MKLLLIVLSGWLTLALAQTSDAVFSSRHEIVRFDSNAASTSARPLKRNLLGLSIEFCYITDYLGDVAKTNTLSYRLLQNIQDITGAPPPIRVGGNTQDVTKYCPACPETLNSSFSGTDTEATNVSFNSNLFRVLNENVPSEQQYIFGLNLGQDDVKIPLAEIAAAQEYLNLSRLTHYELGNEPDFYSTRRRIRPTSWDVVAYAQQSVSYLQQLIASLGHEGHPGFMYGSLANFPRSQDFSISTLARFGVNTLVPDVTAFSGHNYFGEVCSVAGRAQVTIPLYLNHLNTLAVVSDFVPNVEASHSVGAPYIMGETNSAACHGLAGVSDTLTAALWMLDYSLTSATVGMEGLYFHNGVSFSYSAWQPKAVNGTAPHVQALYYGFLFFADLVKDLKHNSKIAPISSLDGVSVVHYAIYPSDSTAPQKLVIMNLDFSNSTIARQQRTFDVSPVFGQQIKVTRLTGPSSDATTGISWAGQTVDDQGNLIGLRTSEFPADGIVSVGSSEAVIVEKV